MQRGHVEPREQEQLRAHGGDEERARRGAAPLDDEEPVERGVTDLDVPLIPSAMPRESARLSWRSRSGGSARGMLVTRHMSTSETCPLTSA